MKNLAKNSANENKITEMKNLGKTGLSMSDAQSASNLAFQIAQSIENSLKNINNYSKEISINGYNNKTLLKGVKMPDNIVELITKKANCHALQAFLMESIKMKEFLMTEEKNKQFTTELAVPTTPKLESPKQLPLVNDSFGWNKLTESEYNEFLQNEALASHYGQFIHKDSILDKLRSQIDTVPSLEWFEIEKDKKTPVDIYVHHTKEELDTLHATFADLHREAEKKVNYYKAKVKNLVSQENARIEKENANALLEAHQKNEVLTKNYNDTMSNYQKLYAIEFKEFQSKKETKLNELSSLKIVVDSRFKTLLDEIIGTKK